VPEGDSIFRAARTLHRALAGKIVTRFESVLPALTRIHEDAPLIGRTMNEVSAAGKHLLMRFSGDLVLRTHMRMNGSWHIYRPGERWQRPARDMRIVIATADFVAVAFNVPVAEFLTVRALARQPELRRLGPDLLGAGFDPVEAARRIRERAGHEIAEVVLDQRVVAGAGNVYKSEILFLAGLHPDTPAKLVPDEEWLTLMALAQQLLKANIAESSGQGIETYRGLRRTTRRMNAEQRLWVYSRGGQPCRTCGTRIASRKDGDDARVTYWCPVCQPMR
jgi:endonuclease-8